MKRLLWSALALSLALTTLRLPAVGAAPAAPTPVSPAGDARLENFSPTLTWSNPPGAAQYQIRVLPFGGDGPGVNLIRALDDNYTVPPPSPEAGNYIMLPDLTYTWQVRVSDAQEAIGEEDGSWGPWSEERTFRTPGPQPELLTLAAPSNGALLRTATPAVTLQWDHPNPSIFYYEVQVSEDPQFRTGADAVSAVWWNLVHGGVSQPRNSWTTPPLEPGSRHYWRVRPRVQGDGTPTGWTGPWSFSVAVPAACCRVSISFDKTRPRSNEPVTVTGRISDWNGVPVSGAAMRATFRYERGPTVTCAGPESDQDGQSSCSRRIEPFSGDRIPVTVEFTYQDQVYAEIAYLYPD